MTTISDKKMAPCDAAWSHFFEVERYWRNRMPKSCADISGRRRGFAGIAPMRIFPWRNSCAPTANIRAGWQGRVKHTEGMGDLVIPVVRVWKEGASFHAASFFRRVGFAGLTNTGARMGPRPDGGRKSTSDEAAKAVEKMLRPY